MKVKMTKNLLSRDLLIVSELLNAGYTKPVIYRFLRKHNYQRIAAGIYTMENTMADEWFAFQQRHPSSIFSHEAALEYLGLSDVNSEKIVITLPYGYGTKNIDTENIIVHTVRKELLELGAIEIRDELGNTLRIYNAERTICDLVRSRNKSDPRVLPEALRAYLRRKDKNIQLLMDYAKQFHVYRILNEYMKILL